MSKNNLYNELAKAFPTQEDLIASWKRDVERGADGETIFGFLVDYARDLGHCKSESWYICQRFLEDNKIWSV